jgi:hypothetical protein
MITSKKGFTFEDHQVVLELLAIISWRLKLTPRPEDDKKMRLALIAINSVAESNAHNEILRDFIVKLPDYIRKTADDPDFIVGALEGDLLLKKLRQAREIFARAESRIQKAFSDFIYRFAYKLAGLSGRGFTGMGSNVGAGDAETLLLIRSELEC